MSEQFSIFDAFPTVAEPVGHIGPPEGLTIEDAFWRFHHDNPHVYESLVQLARDLRDAGAKKIGIGMLFEVLRWSHMRTYGNTEQFKLNNNYRSYYSRLIMTQELDLDGIFETRKLHSHDQDVSYDRGKGR